MVDLDELFAYETSKVVRVRDRWVGIVFYSIQLLILVYVVVGVLWLGQKHLETEFSIGKVSTKIKGTAWSVNNDTGVVTPWDSIGVVIPPIETEGAFIATRIDVTANQTLGICGRWDYPCENSTQCFSPDENPLFTGECIDGLCQSSGWCPDEYIAPANETSAVTVTNHLTQDDAFTIWLQAMIQWASLGSPVYSTVSDTTPVRGENLFTVGELLELAGMSYDDVRTTGTIIEVKANWNCRIDHVHVACAPRVEAQALQMPEQTFNFRTAESFTLADGTPARDLYKMTGVRFFFSSSGVGSAFSITGTILQLSSGLALLSLARVVADYCLRSIMPRREHYKAYKVTVTPDFSDVADAEQKDRERDYDAIPFSSDADLAAALLGDKTGSGSVRRVPRGAGAMAKYRPPTDL